jgi:hypothetical protein
MIETFETKPEAYKAALSRYAHDDGARRFDTGADEFSVTFADGRRVVFRWRAE